MDKAWTDMPPPPLSPPGYIAADNSLDCYAMINMEVRGTARGG